MQLKIRFKDLKTVEFIELFDSKKYKAYKENFPDNLIGNSAKTYGRHFNISRLKIGGGVRQWGIEKYSLDQKESHRC